MGHVIPPACRPWCRHGPDVLSLQQRITDAARIDTDVVESPPAGPTGVAARGSGRRQWRPFYFEAQHGEIFFTLMMLGREDPGEVNVSWKGPSIAEVPNVRHRYYIEFNRAKRRAYVRPLTRDGLPWFEMDVSGGRGNVLFAGQRLQGTADWTIQ